MAEFAAPFLAMGEEGLADTLKFWTKSVGDYLDEYFETDLIKAHMAGSGIIGTTSAYYLARQGHQVSVIDRQPSAGFGSSSRFM